MAQFNETTRKERAATIPAFGDNQNAAIAKRHIDTLLILEHAEGGFSISPNGSALIMKWWLIFIVFKLECCSCPPLLAQAASPGAKTIALEIQAVTVRGKPVTVRKGGEANLGAFAEDIAFQFGPITHSGPDPVRLRYKMEGFENAWHEGGGEMYLAVRFFNRQEDQIYQTNFPIHRESEGWNGSLKSSPLTHRRETVVAPANAASVWIVISSAGPPATVGIYVIADFGGFKIFRQLDFC